MKKVVRNLLTLLICVNSVIIFNGCDNFFEGNPLKKELENVIEYANARYADITINSINIATESLVPAPGNYNDKYKKTDILNLSFTPVSNYQFIKWTALPEGSVAFENADSLVTKAEILNSDSPITIEPMVYARPEITVSPGNAVENPKNSTIIISFNSPLDIPEEDLSKISISVDDISVLPNYKKPYFNSEKTKVTFVPERDNFIDVQSGSRIVKVTVPSSFYYTKENVKISLLNDFNYSFKINSTTETSLEASVNCPSTQGDLSYSGTKVYYLDNEFTVKCTPKKGYSLLGWGATYNDDKSIVDDSILELTTSENGTEATVKILTGSSRPISFFPVLVLQGSVTVSFSTNHGYVVPVDTKLYYIDEEFNVSYREEPGFVFTGWQVLDAEGNIVDDVIELKNANALETECKILKESEPVKLMAQTTSRPTVVNISPTYTGGSIYRDSRITVLFGEKMSEKAIYWTEEELEAENITKDKYDYIECKNRISENGSNYIYAYKEKNDTEENTLKFKNIEICDLNKGTNFLKYYDEPFYESTNNTMLIIPAKMPEDRVEKCVPASNYVKVTVKSSFCSYNLIPTNTEKFGYFFTNNSTDEFPPVVTVSSVKINEETSDDNMAPDLSWRGTSQLSTNKLLIKFSGNITDEGSKPSSLQVKLTPVSGVCPYQNEKEYIETVTLTPSGNSCEYTTENPLLIDINLKDKNEGAYWISFACYDNRNNELEIPGRYGFIYDDGINPDSSNPRVNCPVTKFTKGTLSSAKFTLTGLNNCEYNVFFEKDTDTWTPTNKTLYFNEIWDKGDVKPSKENVSLDLTLKIRDAFTEVSSTRKDYITYEWKSKLEAESATITGRGTIMYYTLTIGEDCQDIKYVYTNISNTSSSTPCPITGLEMFRKNFPINYIDNVTSNIIFETVPDANGKISFGTLFRGLDIHYPIVGTVQFEDSYGGKTDVFKINLPAK